MITLDGWHADIRLRGTVGIARAARLRGVCERHMGPAWYSAEVDAEVSPSTQWDCSAATFLSDEPKAFAEEALLGCLDVLATQYPRAITAVSVRILAMTIHPVNSSRVAFRLAGRDLANRILEQCL